MSDVKRSERLVVGRALALLEVAGVTLNTRHPISIAEVVCTRYKRRKPKDEREALNILNMFIVDARLATCRHDLPFKPWTGRHLPRVPHGRPMSLRR